MRNWLPYPFASLALGGLWLLLNQTLDPSHILLGAALGVAAPLLTRRLVPLGFPKVHPGDSETFGLIVIEAMGCALPVVATRAGGVVELVDEETGMLAEPNCPLSLAATIEQIWSRDLRAMGEQARRKVEQHFAWDQVFPQLMGRYMSLMAHTPPLKPALLRRWRARHRAFDDTP